MKAKDKVKYLIKNPKEIPFNVATKLKRKFMTKEGVALDFYKVNYSKLNLNQINNKLEEYWRDFRYLDENNEDKLDIIIKLLMEIKNKI